MIPLGMVVDDELGNRASQMSLPPRGASVTESPRESTPRVLPDFSDTTGYVTSHVPARPFAGILRDCAWRQDRPSATNLSHADRGGRTVSGPRHAAGKCVRLPVTRIRARRFERHLQEKGDIVWIRWRPGRPGRSCHVVLKLKHREECISPSLLDAELHRHCGSPTRSVSNGDPAPLKRGHESGRVGETLPAGSARPPDALVLRRCPPSAAHVAERTAPAAVAHVLELNLDAVGRVEQDLGRTVTPPSPPRNWWRTVRSECRTVLICAVREG